MTGVPTGIVGGRTVEGGRTAELPPTAAGVTIERATGTTVVAALIAVGRRRATGGDRTKPGGLGRVRGSQNSRRSRIADPMRIVGHRKVADPGRTAGGSSDRGCGTSRVSRIAVRSGTVGPIGTLGRPTTAGPGRTMGHATIAATRSAVPTRTGGSRQDRGAGTGSPTVRGSPAVPGPRTPTGPSAVFGSGWPGLAGASTLRNKWVAAGPPTLRRPEPAGRRRDRIVMTAVPTGTGPRDDRRPYGDRNPRDDRGPRDDRRTA